MAGPLAYLNNRLVAREDACLPIHDAGLVFGAAVTDFCRTFRHRLFRWTDHLARFRRDCQTCFIPLEPKAELTAIAEDLVSHNARLIEPGQELALITFATPGGVGIYGPVPGQNGPPTLCLHTTPLSFERYRPFFTEGISLEIVGRHGSTRDDLLPRRAKHRSRLHWWRADQLLRKRQRNPMSQREDEAPAEPLSPGSAGASSSRDDCFTGSPGSLLALLTDSAGSVTETAIGNLLVVRGGEVHTPGDSLDGISLRVVAEICQQLGIRFASLPVLTLEDCCTASEVMLCGSAFCLAGVRWIAGNDIPWPGPITQRLLAAWSERVGVDIAAQIVSGR